MRAILLALVTVSFMGCSSLLKKVVKEPEVELQRVELAEANLSKAVLNFVLKVDNPNNFELRLDEVNYKIFLQDKDFATAKTDRVISVPKAGSAEVVLPLPVEYKNLWGSLFEIASARNINYRIEGDAKFNLLRVPFAKEGKVSLRGE